MSRRIRRLRTAASLLVEVLAFALIIYGSALLALWLGCLVAGLIALGVAIWLGPSEDEDSRTTHGGQEQ